jgi:hypothetical protein
VPDKAETTGIEATLRTWKSLLNKLTLEKFESISDKLEASLAPVQDQAPITFFSIFFKEIVSVYS